MSIRRIRFGTLPALAAAILLAPGCAGAEPRAAGATTAAVAGGEVVATVGDRKITLAEVDERAKSENMQVYQQLYSARRQAIESIIGDQLIDAEAKARGIDRDELMRLEIADKTKVPGDEDITKFFNENQNRMGGRTIDQVRDQIRQYLTQQAAQTANKTFMDGLKAKANVKVDLDAPRIEIAVAPDEPAMGPASAKVTLIEYSDFQCPYCSRVGPTLDQIKAAYGDKVRIVFRDYPLSFHPQAGPAAEAAQCAHEQGKFWDYHDKLFASQSNLAPEALKSYASELGMDAAKFAECFDSGRHREAVQADFQQGAKYGVTGTPAFFINGRFISGAQPFETFKQIIDEELGG